MPSSTKVLTVNELAEYLRVHRSTIYRLLKKGQLPGFKIGSDWRFNVEVIDEWRLRQGPRRAGRGRGRLAGGSQRRDRISLNSKYPRFCLTRSAAEVSSISDSRLIFDLS